MWLSGPDSNKDKHPDVGILLIVREKKYLLIVETLENTQKKMKMNHDPTTQQ